MQVCWLGGLAADRYYGNVALAATAQ